MAIAIPTAGFCQPDTVWTRGYENSDLYPDLIRTFDGGYVFGSAGWAGFENRPDQDWQILKINSELRIEWRRFYWSMINGRPTGELGCAICQLPDSGFVLGGSCMGTGLVRTDKFGNEVYIRNYLIWDDFESPFPLEMSVALTRDGNLILNANHMLLKVRLADGEVIWRRDFDGRLSRVVPMPDGSFFVAGRTERYDFFSASVDEQGEVVWERIYQFDETEYCMAAVSVTGGGWLLGGVSRFGNNSIDYYPNLMRIGKNGDVLWYRVYNDMRATCALEMVETPDGGFAIVGYSGSGQLWRVDYSGERLWQMRVRPIGTQLHSIFLMDDGGYLLGGTSDVGFYLVRTEPDSVDIPFELTSTAEAFDFGEVWMDSTVCVDLAIENPGRRFVVIDSQWFEGNYSAFDCPLDLPLRIEPTDTAFIPVYFQPRADTLYAATLHLRYGEEQELTVDLTGRGKPYNSVADKEAAYPAEFGIERVFPNPFNSTVRIAFSIPETGLVTISVYDLTGREITRSTRTLRTGNHTLIWSGVEQPTGLYLLKIEAVGQTVSQKLILVK